MPTDLPYAAEAEMSLGYDELQVSGGGATHLDFGVVSCRLTYVRNGG